MINHRPSDSGFAIHEQIFDGSVMAATLEAVNRAEVVRTRAGARHVLSVPTVRALALAPALSAIAREYVGSGAFPFRATLFDKSVAASNWAVQWHQDTVLPVRRRSEVSGWGPWSVKGGVLHAVAPASALNLVIALRVHLDDSTAENGPLRVLAGTHARGILTREQIESFAATVPAVQCLVARGGVVAMSPLVVHASSKALNTNARRVLHIEYAATAHLDPGIDLAIG